MAMVNLLAEVVHDGLEHEDGPRAAEDGEGLAGEEAVHHAHDEAGDQGLHGGHVVAGGVPQQAPEGDDGGEAGEVDEEVRGDALQGHRVPEV